MTNISKLDTKAPESVGKEASKAKTKNLVKELGKLQNLLFANKKHAVLIVLQGIDASGKDGTVEHVFSGINPMGCMVKAFNVPTEEKFAHDFLWRIHQHTPAKGMIQIFNRSHYEDILVPSAHKTLSKKQLNHRLEAINAFERNLMQEGTIILKYHLHISRNEQTRRLDERMDKESKHWKYKAGDRTEAKLWDRYMDTYNLIINKCSKDIPWEIIPADNKWYRNYLISHSIVKALSELNMEYPEHLDGEK